MLVYQLFLPFESLLQSPTTLGLIGKLEADIFKTVASRGFSGAKYSCGVERNEIMAAHQFVLFSPPHPAVRWGGGGGGGVGGAHLASSGGVLQRVQPRSDLRLQPHPPPLRPPPPAGGMRRVIPAVNVSQRGPPLPPPRRRVSTEAAGDKVNEELLKRVKRRWCAADSSRP